MRLLLVFLLLCGNAWGAFTEFYVQTTGSNLNAGSDTNDAAEVSGTNGNWNGTTTYIFSGATDLSGVAAGEWASIYNDGATEAVYVARIATVNDGTDTLTFSTTAKSGTAPTSSATGRSIKVGGAWKGPNAASGFPIGFAQTTMMDASGNPLRVNFKAGTDYAVSTTSGSTVITADEAGPITWEGYTAAPGDGGMAVINGTGGTSGVVFKLMVVTGTANAWKYLHFKGNYAGAPSSGDANGNNMVDLTATNQWMFRCLFTGSWRMGLMVNGASNASASVIEECAAFACNGDDAQLFGGFGAAEECVFIRCISAKHTLADNSDSIGFYLNGSAGEPITLIECISAHNADAGFRVAGATPVNLFRCVAFDNGGDGVETTSTSVGGLNISSCIITDNGGWGININSALNGAPISVRGNAFYNNASGVTQNINASHVSGSVTLTGSPFTDGANGDFSLNNTAGAGADARNSGLGAFLSSASFYSGTTLGAPDLGAAQHDDAGGGGSTPTAHTFLK